jgi:predicted DsbA family dithiol-disulfide isomerase
VVIEIYSDVVCPWCYIGKRKFEAALAQFPRRDEVQVVWRPYQLDPRAPRSPSPVAEAYAKKFGGPEQARQIIDRVSGVAASVGLEFRMDRAQRANTFDAHRLLGFALDEAGAAVQGDLKERLLRAYFTEGLDVADHAVLTRLAGEAGLDAERVAGLLASDERAAETREELNAGVDIGVTAVPTMVIRREFGIPGAQEPETYLRVLERLVPPAVTDPSVAPVCADDVCEI